MNKILSLIALSAFALGASAQGVVYQPSEHTNTLSVVFDESNDDLEMFPLDICLDNPDNSIVSVAMYLYIDDCSVQPWVYDEDEEYYAYDLNSKRAYKSTTHTNLTICPASNEKHHDHYQVIVVDEAKPFKLDQGAIVTIYFDATQLSDGRHTLHVAEPYCSYASTDGKESATYYCTEQSIEFNIANGTVTSIGSIDATAHTAATPKATTFTLTGRRATTAQPAAELLIRDGRKTIGTR